MLLILALVLAIIVEIIILCNKKLARTVPTNYILLGIFTLCEGYIVAAVASLYQPGIVVASALLTAAAVLGLTLYAYFTKSDFTSGSGILAVLAGTLLMLGILTIFFHSPVLTTIYCSIAVFFFGIYLVVDTQMIIGEKRYEINEEDYIFAAMVLYIDIIQLFLNILRILGEKR